MKYNIQHMREAAQQKGGDCITQNYQGLRTHLEWVCKYGHTWMAQPRHIICSGSWCPKCADRERAQKRHRYTIEDMQKYARSRNGECLSKSYLGVDKKLAWKCGDGHEWLARPASMIHRHTWCPHCRYLSEQKCRYIFESIYNMKFPSFMVNMSGEKLQLDGYCPTIKKAFEYQGQQHYKFMPHLHKTEKAFQLRQDRDAKKAQWCKDNGIDLLVIPYWENTNDDKLLSFISQETGVVMTINWSDFYKSLSVLEGLRELAIVRGGELLSNKYEGTMSRLQWRCKCGHAWHAIPDSIKRGSWCAKCANNVRLGLSAMQEIAESREGKCLSLFYKNAYSKLEWECSGGHRWFARPHNVKNGSWCPVCGKINGGKKRRKK